METQTKCKVAIIGSGPAGLTAAVYASRATLEPVLIEGMQPGGQLTITNEIDNFPGFPEGVNANQLIQSMRQQAERFGTKILQGSINRTDLSKRPFSLFTGDQEIKAETVIIASGASANWLGIDSETNLKGKGVSACATCDGFFFKNRVVAVVGGGDTAIEEAIFLTRFASKVFLIHRRNALRASKIMQNKIFENQNVEIVWDSVVEEILDVSKDMVTGIRLKNVTTQETSVLLCNGIFLAIGHTPNTDIFKDQLTMDETGYIITKEKSTGTSVPGVFAAGDVQDSTYRQAITAAGTGCMAAIEAERFLESG
ncbi:MAG: thioredoxin-disulfide reductase [Candidatus Theseobacter exili]|nr:thioredoxin-disulfide reductase [Candidatus Theseobacter exili]